jgi:thiamine-phosphate pyrophosphorylase
MSPRQASADRPRTFLGDLRGLYAVTPDEDDTAELVRKVRLALAGGARLVQYRNKSADPGLRREQSAALLALCRASLVPLIVNDDLELAESIGADGLHLGLGDAPIAAARARLGPGKVLGASCYDRLGVALAAQDAGADYVAFGSAFASSTKPGAVRAPLPLYREAKARLGCPVVAIGGITSRNARSLIDAGVDSVAVISALFDAPDIERRAREFAAMFNTHGFEERSPV